MKNAFFAGVGVATILSASWSGTGSLVNRTDALAFKDLRMHLEVDLPSRMSLDRNRPALPRSFLDLPAEVVLEASSHKGFAQIRLIDSAKRTVLHLDGSDTMALGVSELALETEGVTLGEVLREYRPGEYRVEATTIDGVPIAGTVELGGGFPGFFSVLSPFPGEVISSGDVTISWTPSRGAARYVLEIEQDELGFVFETRLPPWQTSFTIPVQVLQPGETYEYSLVVQGDTDNELEIEGGFVTAGRNHARPGMAR